MQEAREAPAVSVIVPVYGSEAYLDRCVRSVLGQSFSDFELILVDDGSPDRCPQICDEWASRDHRVRVLHRVNGGAAAARNTGLRAARASCVTFVDSDDWIGKRMLERLCELQKQYNADMVLCEMKRDATQRDFERGDHPQVRVLNRKDCLDRFFRLNGGKNPHSVWGGLFTNRILEGFSFAEGLMNEDVHACYCFAERCRLAVCTDEIFYSYTQNMLGVTNSRFSAKKLDLLKMWDMVFDLVCDQTPEYKDACEMNRKRARFTLLCRMYKDGYDHTDAELQGIKRQLETEVRADFGELMHIRMPANRKVFLCLLMLRPRVKGF